ncbi:hypothetical protein ASG63_09450 [Methylobacterium sp. Leaf94]|jgi:hypothetical protein|nr:hypothetical protein ASG63_09450 [Methylobacterium sp. Leaf94]
MEPVLVPLSDDSAAFDFSAFPLAPSGAAPATSRAAAVPDVPARMLDGTSAGSRPHSLHRTLLPWIGGQVAAAIGLGTCLAQAMPPVSAKPLPTDEMAFALRVGDPAEFTGPVPSAIRDGFHLRLVSSD